MKENDSQILSVIELNLFEIATGPIQHDFYVKNKKVNINILIGFYDIIFRIIFKGRIAFDLVLTQIIKIKVKIKEIYCELKDSLQENCYNFSVKIKVKLNF